ncbi:hypothetical protein PPTG_01886 [Phytophthora nicotianae INRA-310]|uniref:Uncharacterized protein n=1 Tax=Phytophthora nicotianae (strain INRA-310) TaxID=761204 RepID=W2R8S8_PHYN3|nr:hypothetical protein PPTG_01886 [Phytophthora nicotianae INRA-310]ETN21793.1 hypothetical protein PPTG_01886 [Phytophthora nicotianae INRA-310]
MLQRVVGRAPVVSELPNVSYIRSLPDLTPRDQRKLKRSGIDQDELTAAFLGIQMISTIAPPPQPPKRTRTFMDGGVLMTRPKMMAAVLEAQRRQKVEERVIKAREGQEKREIQEQAAILKQFEKERRQQEKNKKNKGKIATSTRPRPRKGITQQATELGDSQGVAPSNFGQTFDMYVVKSPVSRSSSGHALLESHFSGHSGR